jgi:hypothetical protein
MGEIRPVILPENAAFLQKRAACISAFLGENRLGNQQRHFSSICSIYTIKWVN